MTTPVAGGWIPHDGGPNPVGETRVQVRTRGHGELVGDAPAGDWGRWWQHEDHPTDIIAYRIVPDVPALTDGEGAFERLTDAASMDGSCPGWIVVKQSDLCTVLAQASAYKERVERAIKALTAADQFITNGIALGFIRMPDAGTPDPALDTPDLVSETLRALLNGADR